MPAIRLMIRHHTTGLRHAGESDAGRREILGVVDHLNALNARTSGMQVESDIRPLASPPRQRRMMPA